VLLVDKKSGRATILTAKLVYPVDMFGNLNGFNVGSRVETKHPYSCK
jgi:hypothetical protein